MDTNTKNHGEIPAPKAPALKKPLLPKSLRGRVLEVNLGYEEAKNRYGIFKVRFKRGTSINGTTVNAGDTALIAGNWAALLTVDGVCEFVDHDFKKDEENDQRLNELDALDRKALDNRRNFLKKANYPDEAA